MNKDRPYAFNKADIDAVYKAIFSRRDMRHFNKNAPALPPQTLKRLLEAAHAAPSVGYMQPWRFIQIKKPETRIAIKKLVENERLKTADAINDAASKSQTSEDFLSIKIEGISDCSDLLVVCLSDQREKYIFGRRTMPFMDIASTSCAIQNIWLAARAEGIGMGWVSIYDPEELATLLSLPEGASAIAILCLGEVQEFYEKPMLELEGWDKRKPLDELIMINQWKD